MERFTNAKMFTNVYSAQCMCVLHRKGSQMPKCSQVSTLATQCMCVFHRKGSQMPKCSQMSTVLNACVCFMERFTNAKMFTSVYTSYSMHVCASWKGSQMSKCSQVSILATQCMCVFHRKGSQMPKCSQISTVLNAQVHKCQKFWHTATASCPY